MRPTNIALNQPNSNVSNLKLHFNWAYLIFGLFTKKKITALGVNEGVNSLAVGMSDGVVFYFKSDILKYKNEKPRLLNESASAITGLAFKNINKLTLIYVATEFTIITITIAGKDKDEKVI